MARTGQPDKGERVTFSVRLTVEEYWALLNAATVLDKSPTMVCREAVIGAIHKALR